MVQVWQKMSNVDLRMLEFTVISLHKGGDTEMLPNGMAISLLPVLSMVVEEIMNRRLISFLTKINILSTR